MKPERVNVFAGVVNVAPKSTAIGVLGPVPPPPVPAAYVIDGIAYRTITTPSAPFAPFVARLA